MNKNRHGLSRHIPVDIATEVRRRSKFGCVVCRCAIYQYEHIEPDFADAKQHQVENICLLCGSCHDRVTRGRLSKKLIRDKYDEVQHSDAIGRPFEELDLSTNSISVVIGTATFEHTKCLIRINGEDILAITPAQDGVGFPTLNGIFYDKSGNESFRITENVWEGPLDCWDIEIVGTSVKIRSEKDQISLCFVVAPPNQVSITKLDMYKDNCRLVCDEKQILIGQRHNSSSAHIGLGNFVCIGADVGISVDSRVIDAPKMTQMRIVGGEGIFLDGTGIHIGAGSAQMIVRDIRLWQQ
jgi:hypothetical protein